MANNIDSVIKSLKKLKKESDKIVDKAVKEVATIVFKNIQTTTAKGKSVNGSSFIKYSALTIKLKGKSNVNLRDTGAMLNDFKVRRNKNKQYTLGFSSSEQRAKALENQNGTRKIPRRKFIGIGRKSQQLINKKLKTFKKKLSKLK